MADTIARLGLELDASPFEAGIRTLDSFSAAAQRVAPALEQLVRTGDPVSRVLADFGRTLSATGPQAAQNTRLLAELGQYLNALAPAGQQATAGLRQAAAATEQAAQAEAALSASVQGGTAAIVQQAAAARELYEPLARIAAARAAAAAAPSPPVAAAAPSVAAAGGAGSSGLDAATRLAAQARSQFGGLAEDFTRVQTAATQTGQGVATMGAALGQAAGQAQAAGTQTSVLANAVQALQQRLAGALGGGASGNFIAASILGGITVEALEGIAHGIVGLTEDVVTYGEAWVMAGQRIQATMGLEQSQARQMRDQLAQASQGVGLDQTFTLAARLGPALQEMGRGGSDTVSIVRTLNELMATSGTDANHASRAFFELARAFAEGNLNGREMRALVGDMPALFRALADGLGVSTGQLMEMGRAGQLTGQQLAEGLIAVAPRVQEQFQGMGTTVSRALTDVSSAFEESAGRAVEDTGAIQALGGAIEVFATLLRSDAVQGTFRAFAQFLADVGKGVQDSARQIEEGKKALGVTPPPTTPRGYFDQALERDRDARSNAEAADQLNRPFKGFQLQTDPGLSDTYSRQAEQSRDQGYQLFLRQGGRGGGMVAGEGTAEQLGATAVPSSYPAIHKDLEGIDTAGKSVADIQEKIRQNQQAIDDLVKPVAAYYDDQNKYLEAQAGYQQKLSGYQTERAKLEQEIGTAQKGQDIQRIVDQQHVSYEVAQKRYALMGQENQGLDTIAGTQAKIKQLEQDRATFPERASQINQLIAQQQQHLHELEQRRAQTAQGHADAIANQRNALLAQEGPEAALAAAEEKIARARKEGTLQNDAQVAQASAGAYERFFKGVEQQAAAAAAGGTQVERVTAQIDAVQQAMAAHTETRAAGEKEVNRLTEERQRLLDREQDQLDKQDETIEKGIATAQSQLAQLRARGGAEIGTAVEQARRAAEGQVQLPTPEQMDAPGGGALFDRRLEKRQLRGDLAEQNVLQQQYNSLLQQVRTPLQAYNDNLAKNDELLARGKLTLDEYARAVVGIVTPQQRFDEEMDKIGAEMATVNRLYEQGNISLARRNELLRGGVAAQGRAAAAQRQANVQQDFDIGEAGSGASTGNQITAGLDAGLAQLTEQYGNLSKQIATGFVDAFNTAADAFTQFLTTGKADWRGMMVSILDDLTKLAVEYTMISALRAAVFGFGGGGGGGGGAGTLATFARTDSLISAYGHTGGMVEHLTDKRPVDPAWFIGAPRAHAGLNLANDDVPIVARRGERVLSPAETAAYSRGGGSGGTSISMTIHVDARGGTDPSALQAAATRGAQAGAAQALARVNRNPALRQKVTGR